MFCNQCGEDNRNDRKFCTNCGAPLRDYTKPRENLIMPEEIEQKKASVAHKNKVVKVFNIINLIIQLIVVTSSCSLLLFPGLLRISISRIVQFHFYVQIVIVLSHP